MGIISDKNYFTGLFLLVNKRVDTRMLCISNTTLIKEASMFSVNTHQKKWKHYSFFNCTWTNNTVFYYSCYLHSNFSAFILSFYKRSKRKSRNKFTAIFWCELNSPSKHNQNTQQHMGLFSQYSSSTLGKINHMAGRNQLGVAINGVHPGLKLWKRKDYGSCKTQKWCHYWHPSSSSAPPTEPRKWGGCLHQKRQRGYQCTIWFLWTIKVDDD